jgi:hypothetical protein
MFPFRTIVHVNELLLKLMTAIQRRLVLVTADVYYFNISLRELVLREQALR